MNDERLPGRIYDGFKVVLVVPWRDFPAESRRSCFAEQCKRLYEPFQWVMPIVGAGPLAVFVSENSASNFLHGVRSSLRIYKCKYHKSKFKQLWYNMAGLHRTYLPENELPQGTDFADAVMITEEVK
jgi:hypothetical protein